MLKKLITISMAAFILTACGGSSDDDNGPVTGGTDTGTDTGTDGDGPTAPPAPVGGETGASLFGDTAAEGVGIDPSFPLCPANITGSFSGFAQDPAGNFCRPGCPAIAEDDDGDGFGSFPNPDGSGQFACIITAAAPGTLVTNPFSAPIDGCPAPNGCPGGSFPRVRITPNAGSELAGSYTCTAWLFDEVTQVWGEEASPAPFALTLNTDFSAEISGTPTTWSFSSGVLTLEGNTTFNNVAFGGGSFSSYRSNTSLTRCRT